MPLTLGSIRLKRLFPEGSELSSPHLGRVLRRQNQMKLSLRRDPQVSSAVLQGHASASLPSGRNWWVDGALGGFGCSRSTQCGLNPHSVGAALLLIAALTSRRRKWDHLGCAERIPLMFALTLLTPVSLAMYTFSKSP